MVEKGDIILIEQVDSITRLNPTDWLCLKNLIINDLPTFYVFLEPPIEDFTSAGMNDMVFDVLAAVASKDYEDRCRRQAQGVQRAKAEGKYKGRPVDEDKHKHIAQLLKLKTPWRDIEKLIPSSTQTIVRVKKEMAANEE